MENHSTSLAQAVVASKGVARRMLAFGENRIELLAVEVQEGRERLLHAVLLTVGVTALGLLTGFALTAALTVLFWEKSPVGVLFTLTLVYAAGAGFLYQRLNRLRRDWQIFPATLEQLRKDRECLEQILN